MVILNPINTQYEYQYQTSVSIHFDGRQYANLSPSKPYPYKVRVAIGSVTSAVFYNKLLVHTSNIVYQYPPQDLIINLSRTNDIINDPDNPLSYLDFSASQYIGNLTVSNILLETYPQYVYTFQLCFHFNYWVYDVNGAIINQDKYNQRIENVHMNSTCNLTGTDDPNYYSAVNCDIE